MARRCTTVAGYGACCAAAMQNRLGQPIPVGPAGRKRCGVCTQITKRNGAPGFHFRFLHSASCGLGGGGCPALSGGQQGALALPMQ